MLSALILSTVLSQQATCQSAYGQTACGYDCVAAYGTLKCAPMPGGSCLAAYGQVACGYGCTAAFGQLKCASNPGGTCAAAYGEVTCFDPPRRQHRRWVGARSECKSAYGTTACGYGCVAAYGVVRCAQTPQGTCSAAYGQVTCFDPR